MSVRLSFFIVLILCLNLHANINNLKGTFDVLKDKYKEFSILNGAIADQTGYIMRLYDYGTLGQMRMVKIDQSTVAVPDISNAPDVVKLVHLFFHRTSGTIGRGDFVFTRELRSASDEEKEDIIKAIAWMMAQIKKIEKIITKSKKNEAAFSQQLKHMSLKELTVKGELSHLKYLATLENTCPISKIMREQPEVLKLFKLIWQANQQEKGAKAIFPLYATDTVLLGIVYELAGTNKNLYKAFYGKLNDALMGAMKKEALESTIFVNDSHIPESWINEQFNPLDRQPLGEQLTFKADNVEHLKQHYENIIYLALLPEEYPILSGYTTAYYYYDPSHPAKNVHFSDCMENTFRNLLNVWAYDPKTISFDLMKNKNIHPLQSLVIFYTNNKDASNIENSALHNQWTDVIENIPFVAYNNQVGIDSSADEIEKRGFIKVPQGVDLGDKYALAGQDDIVYEIQPSLRNVIIVFNHLLGLALFDDEPGNTAEEKIAHAFKRSDFIKTYFPLMCKKLEIEFNGFYLSDEIRIDETIDTKDYDGAIISKLKIHGDAPDTDVILATSRKYGQMEVINKKTAQNRVVEWFNANRRIIVDSANNFFYSCFSSLPYLVAHKLPTELYEIFSKIDAVHSFNLFFYLPINNSDYIKDLTLKLSQLKIQLNEYALRLLLSCTSSILDVEQKQSVNLRIYAIMIGQEGWNPKGGLYGFKNSSVQELIKAAADAIRSGTWFMADSGIAVFKALFEKRQGYKEAIRIAADVLGSTDYSVRRFGLELTKALLAKGEGYQEVIEIALNKMKSANQDFREDGVVLFDMIIKNGRGYDKAIQAASDAIKSKRWQVQSSGIELLIVLVEQGQAYQMAIQAALGASKGWNEALAFQLFKTIFNQLEKIPPEKMTPELREIIKQAIDVGKSVDASTTDGKEILKMAQELEKKIEKKE